MNIFIEPPTWLGDTIMTTPSIEAIVKKYSDAKPLGFSMLVIEFSQSKLVPLIVLT